MKKNLNHPCVCLWAFALAFALLLSGCGTDAAQSAGGDPEPAGQDTGEGWKPTDSVNLIVPFAAGGANDIMARAIAQYIDLDGQTMYVTNIEGGSSSIGAMEAYHADNDGLTLLMYAFENCATGYAGGTLPENLCGEMTWVASLAIDPFLVAAAAGSPYESLEDVIAAAEADPGGMTLAGTGSDLWKTLTLTMQRVTGAEFNIVPYDSAAKARVAVLGGHEDLFFGLLSDMKPYADSGEMRILAIGLEERTGLVPDVPTFKELGYDGLTIASNRSVSLPPETDEEIARYYEGKLREVFENGEFQSVARDTQGFNTNFTGRDDLSDKVIETLEWAKEYVPLTMG